MALDKNVKPYSRIAAIKEAFGIVNSNVLEAEQRKQLHAIRAHLDSLEDGGSQVIEVYPGALVPPSRALLARNTTATLPRAKPTCSTNGFRSAGKEAPSSQTRMFGIACASAPLPNQSSVTPLLQEQQVTL